MKIFFGVILAIFWYLSILLTKTQMGAFWVTCFYLIPAGCLYLWHKSE